VNGTARPGTPPVDWAGLAAWLAATFPDVATIGADELAARIASGAPPMLVDVRTAAEQAVSTLRGACCVQPDADPHALAADAKGRGIVVYCSVGVRSARLARRLAAAGCSDVRNLDGGIFAWANAGRDVWRAGCRVRAVHGYDATWSALLDPSVLA
jgi:rhodanese-related sulfurtransferase